MKGSGNGDIWGGWHTAAVCQNLGCIMQGFESLVSWAIEEPWCVRDQGLGTHR